MTKKIFTAVFAAAVLMCTAGCTGEYEMTEEDLALQKSIEGVWLADSSTGYNEYDENGYYLLLTAVEFTEDCNYLLHCCMPGDGEADGYVMTYPPVAYTIEDKLFRVDVDGTPNYAKISVSDDGQTLLYITDDQTDKFIRLTEDERIELGIPEYDSERWAETEAESEDETEENSETVPESESEAAESGIDENGTEE